MQNLSRSQRKICRGPARYIQVPWALSFRSIILGCHTWSGRLLADYKWKKTPTSLGSPPMEVWSVWRSINSESASEKRVLRCQLHLRFTCPATARCCMPRRLIPHNRRSSGMNGKLPPGSHAASMPAKKFYSNLQILSHGASWVFSIPG